MTETAAPLGRRERNKAAKRARILAAAQQRFASQGYDGTTMAQVADDADVAIGTVFQYAATKPELLMMVTAERWREVLHTVVADLDTALDDDSPHATRGEQGDPVETILGLMAPVVATSLDEPELSMSIARELLFGVRGEHHDEVAEIIEAVELAVVGILQRAGATTHADSAARLVVSGCLLEINRTRTGRADAASVQTRLRDIVEVVVRGAVTS